MRNEIAELEALKLKREQEIAVKNQPYLIRCKVVDTITKMRKGGMEVQSIKEIERGRVASDNRLNIVFVTKEGRTVNMEF